MPDSPAQRLISLNRQAVAILRLGIPLDLGLGRDAEEQLLEINDRLIAETGRELSVEAWLQQQTLPERYREFAKVLLLCDDPAPVFESIAAQDLEREAAVNPIRQAFAEPLVVAILAYFGMILLCSFTVPHIQSQYVQEGREPVGLTWLLIELRNLMPYWIIAFPMLALGSWWLWRKLSKGKSLDRFPGVSYCSSPDQTASRVAGARRSPQNAA